jgi:hypothetical protein
MKSLVLQLKDEMLQHVETEFSDPFVRMRNSVMRDRILLVAETIGHPH